MQVIPRALRGYQKQWLNRDAIAGVTLAAVAIPEVMGYTAIAQMPIQTGLYTVLLPTVAFALLGSSMLLVVGADSATAAVLAAGLAAVALPGLAPYSAQWVALGSLTALVCGGLLVLARVFRLGFIGDFLSSSVLVGFLTGVGIQVLSGQIPDMLGVAKTGSNWFAQQWHTITEIPEANIPTVAYAAITLVTMLVLKRVAPRVPGAVVAVALCIIGSVTLDSAANGVAVVGAVPSGFPPIGLPQGVTLHDALLVLGTAFSCFVLIVAQSAATSRSFAAKHGESVDINTDLVGLSAASLAAGLSGTFVVNGSPTKTQILDAQGGRSQVANLVMSAVVLVFTLFATGLLTDMPKATLAAIVFLIGVSLIDVAGLRRIAAARRSEFYIAMLTCVVVFAIGVEQGIVLAIVASLVEIVRRAYRPAAFVVGDSSSGSPTYTPAAPGQQSEPGLIVFRFDAELFYANVGRFVDNVKALVESAPDPVRWLLIDASSLDDVDYSASLQLDDLLAFAAHRGVTVGIVALDEALARTLGDYHLKEPGTVVGPFADVAAGIAAFRAAPAPTAQP